MKFSIVERKKHKRILDRDFRRIVIGIGTVFFVAILSVLLNFLQLSNIIFGVACIFAAAAYMHYSNNIFSYIHYYDVSGVIDFEEDLLIINDEEFSYEKIKQINFHWIL